MSSYYQRLRWMCKPKPVWYRQEQLNRDACDRWLGHTPYGRMFSKFARNRWDPKEHKKWLKKVWGNKQVSLVDKYLQADREDRKL
ncbi:MAG: hypothetical protein QOJ40_1116 [Verrucomicrobiota bacterium]